MSDIVLCTLNARYWHSSFGLRYLLANLGPLQQRTTLLEFGIKDHTIDLLGRILEQDPRLVGFGVYIWNIEPITKLIAELKRVAPQIMTVIGGPEVSHENTELAIAQMADYVIAGEADLAFPQLASQILNGLPPVEKFVTAPVPSFEQLELPYHLYDADDIRHRVIYVEASRGCPFTCEFCLSALEVPVRAAPIDAFLDAMQSLLDRGARQFKFVDRTFNLNLRISKRILTFFLERYEEGLFLHFEMIPDRLPEDLKTLIAEFPQGALQFEIGVQTFNETVGQRISRTQDNSRLEENFRYLVEQTGVHLHADLIVGLPGESIESFGQGLDRLVQLGPQEIQVGMLKRLRGTPVTRHDAEWNMTYSPNPPYEILATREIEFAEMQRMRRFARYWDLYFNSGNFTRSCPLIWKSQSPFQTFRQFSDWLYATERRTHGIALKALAKRLFEYLTEVRELPAQQVATSIWDDYVRGGRFDKPAFLKPYDLPSPPRTRKSRLPPRQARHVE